MFRWRAVRCLQAAVSRSNAAAAAPRGSALLQQQQSRAFGASPVGTIKFTKTDEWVRVVDQDEGVAAVGITDYAQDHLGDVIFCEVECSVGDELEAADEFGSVESTKAVAALGIPLGGTVTEVNEDITEESNVGKLNSSPEDEAWLVKLKYNEDEFETGDMMDLEAYKKYCAGRD